MSVSNLTHVAAASLVSGALAIVGSFVAEKVLSSWRLQSKYEQARLTLHINSVPTGSGGLLWSVKIKWSDTDVWDSPKPFPFADVIFLLEELDEVWTYVLDSHNPAKVFVHRCMLVRISDSFLQLDSEGCKTLVGVKFANAKFYSELD